MAINHLKQDAQYKWLTVAFGLQRVKGRLCWSKSTGVAPNHQITALNALGEGEWNACKSAYYKGVAIPPADFNFHTGALATGMTTGAQVVDSFFPLDVPHTRSATIGYKCPVGLGSADTQATPPTDFEGIFETKKTPNYNSAGVQTDFSYSPNPARCIVELLRTYCRLPNLPSAYASAAAYWLSRIDWGVWTAFRDYCDTAETVDYTTISDAEGFGLTASWFTGTNFNTFLKKFVQPAINFPSTTAAPVFGLTTSSFSARFEGFIKAKYSETYTFSVLHDAGCRLYIAPVGAAEGVAVINQWADDANVPTATHTGTYAMTADVFYQIKLEWNNGDATSQLEMKWSSTSQPIEIVSNKYLYPMPESRATYESHVFFDSPIAPADAIRQILFVSNSIMQDANGKLRFFCLEQLTSSFTLNNSNIDSFSFRRRDILQSDPITLYEADFNDLDLQFIERPTKPVQIPVSWVTRKLQEKVKVVPLYNTTRWQARKILQTRARLEVGNDLLADVEAKMSKTYPILAGDLITATHRKIGASSKNYLVREAVDKGVAESKQIQGSEPEARSFVLQEWS